MRFLITLLFISVRCYSTDIYESRVKNIDYLQLSENHIDVSMLSEGNNYSVFVNFKKGIPCEVNNWLGYALLNERGSVEPYEIFRNDNMFFIRLKNDYKKRIYIDLVCKPGSDLDIYRVNVLLEGWNNSNVTSWKAWKTAQKR